MIIIKMKIRIMKCDEFCPFHHHFFSFILVALSSVFSHSCLEGNLNKQMVTEPQLRVIFRPLTQQST